MRLGITSIAAGLREGMSERESVYCKHCGKAIDADSGFCKHCGKMQ